MEETPRETNTLTDEERAAIVRAHLSAAGKKGGETMRKRGPDYYREIGKKGAAKRWNKEQ